MKKDIQLNLSGTASKAGLLLLLLMLSGLAPANELGNDDEPISMASLAATKTLGDYTVYAAGAKIYEAMDGKLASLGVVGKVNNHLYWDVGYFGLFTKISAGDVIHDNRSRAKLTYIKSFDTWRLSVRPMLEYRSSEVLNGFRFRPEFAFFYPLSLHEQKILPYFKVEPFYDQKLEETTLTLISLGAEWSINAKLAFSADYIRAISHRSTSDMEGPAATLKIRL